MYEAGEPCTGCGENKNCKDGLCTEEGDEVTVTSTEKPPDEGEFFTVSTYVNSKGDKCPFKLTCNV